MKRNLNVHIDTIAHLIKTYMEIEKKAGKNRIYWFLNKGGIPASFQQTDITLMGILARLEEFRLV